MAGHDVEKLIKIYQFVFGALIIGTIATVAVTYIEFSPWLGIAVGLAIATVKGSLVGGYFMHLVWEQKSIIHLMLLTAFFFAAMMGLIMWHAADVPTYEPSTIVQ